MLNTEIKIGRSGWASKGKRSYVRNDIESG